MALGRFFVLNKEVTAGPGRTPRACIWWGGRQCPHTHLPKCKKETCFSFLSLVDSSVLLRTPLCIIISRNLSLSYCFCSVFHLEHYGSSVSWCMSAVRKGEHMYREGLESIPCRETPNNRTRAECDFNQTGQQHVVSRTRDQEGWSSQRSLQETRRKDYPLTLLLVFGCHWLLQGAHGILGSKWWELTCVAW